MMVHRNTGDRASAAYGLPDLNIDWLAYCYKAKCIVQWAEEHIRKDVSRLNSKLASITNIQVESSQTISAKVLISIVFSF